MQTNLPELKSRTSNLIRKHLLGQLSKAETAELEQWIEADPTNKQLFLKTSALYATDLKTNKYTVQKPDFPFRKVAIFSLIAIIVIISLIIIVGIRTTPNAGIVGLGGLPLKGKPAANMGRSDMLQPVMRESLSVRTSPEPVSGRHDKGTVLTDTNIFHNQLPPSIKFGKDSIIEINRATVEDLDKLIDYLYHIHVIYLGKVTKGTFSGALARNFRIEGMLKLLQSNGIKANYDGTYIIVRE